MIVLLTGESGSGKTTLCVRIVASLKTQGLDVAGVLTLPRFANGEKVRLDLEDVRTGKVCALADHTTKGQGTADLAWRFSATALQQGADILRDSTPCDVLVIDELGPLELVHGAGWIVALDVLQAGNYHSALVVVRPELIEAFQMRLKSDLVLTVTALTREELFEQIIHILDRRIHANSQK
jgi:nucleoside-triphosphatase